MGIEDQKEEREILESIYPDEITGPQTPIVAKSQSPNISFQMSRRRNSGYQSLLTCLQTVPTTMKNMKLVCDPHSRSPNYLTNSSTPATIILNVQYPPDYPDEAPRLDISTPPNAPKHEYLDIQEDKARLLSSLSDTKGAYQKRIRKGRGPASGKGKTAGRGQKGQHAHGKVPTGFEGGQTPLSITKPERGRDKYNP